MKQMIFMLVTTFMGVAGSFTLSPLWGVGVYYLFAVLRPQFIWEWTDAMGTTIGDWSWSFYVAVATLVATTLWRLGLLAPVVVMRPPWYGNPGYTRSHFLFYGFVFWICLSYLTATSEARAAPWTLEYVKIFTMFACATLVLRTVGELWVIYFIVLGSAVYAGYEINAYYFSSGFMLLQQRGYGGLDNNGAALIVAMAVPMAYFAWEGHRHWTRWGFLLAVPILVHALMLSFSRGGMLSLAVAGLLVWVRARNKWFLSAGYALAAVFVLASAGKELQDRFFSIAKHDVDASAQSRWTTWAIAVRMANERPFLGFGVRCSNLYTRQYGADMDGRSIHSQYLQTAADSGWVALFLYLALLASVFVGLWEVRGFLRRFPDPGSRKVSSMASGLECALVLFCFGAIFLSLEHFEMPYILLLLAMQLHAITRTVAARHALAGRPATPAVAT